MYKDEVISELWRVREAYAAEHGHDLKLIVADLQERQAKATGVTTDRRRSHRPRTTTDRGQTTSDER